MKFFVRLWKRVTGLGIEKLKLSAAKWSVLSYYENMYVTGLGIEKLKLSTVK